MTADCLECGAPCESTGRCEMPGVDFDGRDAIFIADKILCAAGHRYHLINEDLAVKL